MSSREIFKSGEDSNIITNNTSNNTNSLKTFLYGAASIGSLFILLNKFKLSNNDNYDLKYPVKWTNDKAGTDGNFILYGNSYTFLSEIKNLSGKLPSKLFYQTLIPGTGPKLSLKTNNSINGTARLFLYDSINKNFIFYEALLTQPKINTKLSELDKGIKDGYKDMQNGEHRIIIVPISKLGNNKLSITLFNQVHNFEQTNDIINNNKFNNTHAIIVFILTKID